MNTEIRELIDKYIELESIKYSYTENDKQIIDLKLKKSVTKSKKDISNKMNDLVINYVCKVINTSNEFQIKHKFGRDMGTYPNHGSWDVDLTDNDKFEIYYRSRSIDDEIGYAEITVQEVIDFDEDVFIKECAQHQVDSLTIDIQDKLESISRIKNKINEIKEKYKIT